MKKSLIFLAGAGMMILAGCNKNVENGSVDSNISNPPVSDESSTGEVVKLKFAKETYEIDPKDIVTVDGDLVGVVYSFQGGTPDGVTLNSETGEIDFDAYGNPIPEKVYLATYQGKTVSTIIKFKMQEEKPVITFQNPSDYLIDGDYVLCTSKTDKGREYSVAYSLKEDVSGLSINQDTGKVSFGDALADGTSFTVVAESKNVTSEHTFIAMKNNIVYSENEVILEKGKVEDAYFTLNFNGNAEASETTSADVKLILDNEIKEIEGFIYDKNTKTIKIPSSYLSTLSTGEHNFKVTTKRNSVPLSLAIADKVIYDGKELTDVFQADYSSETPTFKEDSLAGYYALGCDIDLTEVINSNNGDWAPIGAYNDGVYDIPFTGTFNGNGYAITGFTYKGVAPVNGLFGRLTGTVKNLKLVGDISAVKSWSGALVGNNAGTIENVIADVSLVNDGQSATGVLCSVNHGVIQNCLSINENVKGNIDPDLSWKQSGLVIGLNETDGSVKNVYAVGEGQLFGYSQNSEVTTENSGKVFQNLDEMKAYDFSKLPSKNFTTEVGTIPTLKVLSVSHNPGYFAFDTLPQYALKGDEVDLAMKIKPVERESEYQDLVTYKINGESYGAEIVDQTLSLTNLNVPSDGATISIEATLKLDEYGIDISATASLLVYNSISGLKIANTDTVLEAGDTVELLVSTTPESTIEASFTAASEAAWKSCYYSISGNKLSIKDDCPDGLDITVTASAIGETATKTFTVKKLTTFNNNNQVHYNNDDTDFVYAIDGLTAVSSLIMDGVEVNAGNYSVADNKLTLKKEVVAAKDVQHVLKFKDSSGTIYRAFATVLSDDKVDETWLNNAFGTDGYTKINSLADFNKYFAYDGKTHTDLVNNMSRSAVYALTADLDFSGLDFEAIGKNLNGEEDNAIFNGQFYGLGHTIKNISINKEGSSWCDGFFCQIGGEGIKAVVQDINFENVSIQKAGGNFTGILASMFGDTAVAKNINAYNCTVISGDDQPFNHSTYLGGLVGRSWTNLNSQVKYSTYNGYNINLFGTDF